MADREGNFKELVRCYKSLYHLAQVGTQDKEVIRSTEDTAKRLESELGL